MINKQNYLNSLKMWQINKLLKLLIIPKIMKNVTSNRSHFLKLLIIHKIMENVENNQNHFSN